MSFRDKTNMFHPYQAGHPDFKKFKYFIFDVDGVLTDGKFHYTRDGKVMKVFGPDDNDALKLINKMISIHFFSADYRGIDITQQRLADMGFEVRTMSTRARIDWIKTFPDPHELIYMGDGIFDPLVFKEVGYSIAPANASRLVRDKANYVTSARGGEGAVAEVCIKYWEEIKGIEFDATKINLDEL